MLAVEHVGSCLHMPEYRQMTQVYGKAFTTPLINECFMSHFGDNPGKRSPSKSTNCILLSTIMKGSGFQVAYVTDSSELSSLWNAEY